MYNPRESTSANTFFVCHSEKNQQSPFLLWLLFRLNCASLVRSMDTTFLGLARTSEITSVDDLNEFMQFHADTKTYSLLLRWKPLSDTDMQYLTIKLADKQRIIDTLDIGRTSFSAKNFMVIAPSLRTTKVLVNLDLGHNALGFEGAQRIARILSDNCSLEYLNLEWNKIGDAGIITIVKALQDNQNSHLSVLDIHSNEITADGALVCYFHTYYLFILFTGSLSTSAKESTANQC